MPNIKSAKKRLRSSVSRHDSNLPFRTKVKTARRNFVEALSGDDQEARKQAFSEYCSSLDRAAKKGVLSKNTAVRRKGRASERLRAAAG